MTERGDKSGSEAETNGPGVPAGSTEETSTQSAGEENGQPEDRGSETSLDKLGRLEGWQVEGSAARVHYRGGTERYSIEYYAPSDCTLYWKVPPAEAGETAVPVGRDTVPEPLRERVREDLATAGIDPEIDTRSL